MRITKLIFIYVPFIYLTHVGTPAGDITVLVRRSVGVGNVKFDIVFEYRFKNEYKSIVDDLCSFWM